MASQTKPRAETTLDLQIKFEGDLKSGVSLEAFYSTHSAIFSMLTEVAQASNKSIEVQPRIVDRSSGSLVSELAVVFQSAVDMFNQLTADDILTYLNMLKTLVEIFQSIRGKKISEVKTTYGDEVLLKTRGDDSVIQINTFFYGCAVRSDFRRAGYHLTEDEMIVAVTVISASHNFELRIDREDFVAFRENSLRRLFEDQEPILERRVLILQRIDFSPEQERKWSFKDSGGKNFEAYMRDPEFLSLVLNQQESFKAYDIITAEVSTHRGINPGTGKPKIESSIVKVLNHQSFDDVSTIPMGI